MHGRRKGANRILVEKPEGKSSLERPRVWMGELLK